MGRLRTIASDAGFVMVLGAMVFWVAGMPAGLVPPGTLPVVAVYLHAWLTILDGGWTALRRVTWLLLVLGWFGAVAADFFGYLLPWGQAGFWLASMLASLPLVGDAVAGWASGGALSAAADVIVVVPFAADVTVAAVHRLRGRPAWGAAAILAAAAALAALLWVGTPPPTVPAAPDDLSTPAYLVPRWYMLPWYAMLRGPADKLLGVALMAMAVLLPAGAPLMRAERFRSGAAGIVWPLLCLALLLDFIGLGLLGARPPEGDVVVASRLLTAGWFAFFLLAAPILGRAGRRGQGAGSA